MKKKYRARIKYIYLVFIFLFVALSLRIAYLQIFRRNFLRNLAQKQHYRLIPLEGERGNIFDRRGKILATGVNSYSIFADPYLIDDVAKTAETLTLNLELNKDNIRKLLQKDKRFVWIKRKISWEEKEKVQCLGIRGIGFLKEEKRFYSQETLAAAALGIVGIDNEGLSGLELEYDDYLRGKEGWVRVLQDSASRQIILSPQIIKAQQGVDVTTTIDIQMQYWAQLYLKDTIKEFCAKKGSVIVMNAATGAVLVLANYPTFNPNSFRNASLEHMNNYAITEMFEPGSVFKITTLIAAIEEGAFSNEDKFFCEEGKFKIPGSYLHDWRPYGELKFTEVFKKSSNIGVAKIANSLGPLLIYKHIKKLGFGQKGGIDLPGEISGKVKEPSQWSKTSNFIIPIGQEVGVNLLQLVRVFAAVANGGYLVKPYMVENISAPFFLRKTTVKRARVISEAGARRAKDILIGVVEEGTAKLAAIEGVRIGGKTGTAQKYDPKIGKYSPNKYRATFVGFISDIDEPLVIGVSIDEPKKSHFGGVVAAPLFKKLAEKIIKYSQTDKTLVQVEY
ncbi:MAG: penicillin-binding protein 2 [Candidatus Omnitrophota bacterium]|nr:MAG: penicillin-binding protein 2 [Candidatus Omnitrophota bacterium]